jgi:hypothetical protein
LIHSLIQANNFKYKTQIFPDADHSMGYGYSAVWDVISEFLFDKMDIHSNTKGVQKRSELSLNELGWKIHINNKIS